jgi:hypothetical protein
MTSDRYSAWLRREFGALVDEFELDEPQKRYLRSRWLDQLVWLEGKAKTTQQRYYVLRLLAIVGGLVVPALVSLNVGGDLSPAIHWVTFSLSLIVASAIAVEGFFHHGERWRHFRRISEQMKGQGWQFYELAGPYEGYRSHGAAFKAFAAAVEGLLAEEVDVYIRQVVREQAPASGEQAGPTRSS